MKRPELLVPSRRLLLTGAGALAAYGTLARAGSMTLLGAGVKSASGVTPATFVIDSYFQAAGGAQSFTFTKTGAAVGDIIFVLAQNNAAGVTASLSVSGAMTQIGTSVDTAGDIYVLYWGILAAGDLTTNTVAFSTLLVTEPVAISIWHGGTLAANKAFQTGTTGSLAFAGFPPSGSSKGVIAIMMNNGIGSTAAATPSVGTWTTIRNGFVNPNTFFNHFLFLEPTGYTNATVTFSGFTVSAQPQAGYLIELT